jgi:hypothetical protein
VEGLRHNGWNTFPPLLVVVPPLCSTSNLPLLHGDEQFGASRRSGQREVRPCCGRHKQGSVLEQENWARDRAAGNGLGCSSMATANGCGAVAPSRWLNCCETRIADIGTRLGADVGVDELRVEALATWRSQRTGAYYPVQWRRTIPRADVYILVEPLLNHQMNRRSVQFLQRRLRFRSVETQPGSGYLLQYI